MVEVSDALTRSGCWGGPCRTTSWQRLLAVGQQRGGQSGSVAEATEQSAPADTSGSRHLVRGGAVRAMLVEQSRGPECRPAAARRIRALFARRGRHRCRGAEFRRVLFMCPVQFPDHNMWSGNYGSQGAAGHWFTASTTAREASPPRFACKGNGRHERQRVRKLLAARVAHPDTA